MAKEEKVNDRKNGNSDKEEVLANEVIDQYLAARSDMDGKSLFTLMEKCDDYYMGRQNGYDVLNSDEDDPDDPKSTSHFIHGIVETQVGEDVDTDLEITAEPYDVAGADHVEKVERACMWVKDANKFFVKMERGARWRRKFGWVWSHVTYDPGENPPHGMIKLGFEAPNMVFCDPKVRGAHLIDEADFVILRIPKSTGWFKRNFEKGKYVKADTMGQDDTFDHESPNTVDEVARDQAYLFIRYSLNDDGYLRCVKVGGQDSMVILYDSNEDKALENEDGTRSPWLKLRKYPLRPLVLWPKEGQIAGMGVVELLIPVVDLINDLDDQIRMNARQMAWLIWFVSAAAGVNVKLLNTRASGTVIPIRGNLPPGQAVNALQPKELPVYVRERRETAKTEVRDYLNRPSVQDGFRQQNVDTYGGMALLAQQGQKRATHDQKMLYEHLSEVFEIVVEMMKQLFTETMPISVRDQDNKVTWLPFKGADLADIPRFYWDGARWSPLLDEDNNPMTQEGHWRIHIKASHGLPKDNLSQYGNLLALMQSGASQLLFQGLTPEDLHRVRKQIFSMIGVQISDQPAPMMPPEGQAQGAMPVQGAQGMPPATGMEQQMEPPGRGIAQELQAILANADPAEAQAAWNELPEEVRQAILTMGA